MFTRRPQTHPRRYLPRNPGRDADAVFVGYTPSDGERKGFRKLDIKTPYEERSEGSGSEGLLRCVVRFGGFSIRLGISFPIG